MPILSRVYRAYCRSATRASCSGPVVVLALFVLGVSCAATMAVRAFIRAYEHQIVLGLHIAAAAAVCAIGLCIFRAALRYACTPARAAQLAPVRPYDHITPLTASPGFIREATQQTIDWEDGFPAVDLVPANPEPAPASSGEDDGEVAAEMAAAARALDSGKLDIRVDGGDLIEIGNPL